MDKLIGLLLEAKIGEKTRISSLKNKNTMEEINKLIKIDNFIKISPIS